MGKLTKQHDPLAKKFLSNIIIAKNFLQVYLAPEILAKCDLESLRIESGSYVEENLKTQYSDIVYGLDLIDNKGCAYIYTLIEHQSKEDELMPFRILKYQMAVMQKHMDTHKSSKLPVVIPIIFYNGKKSPYPYSLNIADLYADPGMFNKIQLGNFKLVDLTIAEDNELLKHGKLALLEIAMKHIHAKNFVAVLEVVIAALQIARENNVNLSLVDGFFSYLINARETEDIEKLKVLIEKNVPYYQENLMSYATDLIQKGKHEGMQEGIQLGKQEGIQLGKQEGKTEAKFEIARNLLKLGTDEKIVAKVTHLTLDEIKTLH